LAICGAVAFCLAAFGLSVPGHAETWPSRAVHVIVPFTAGGSADILTRMVTTEMSKLSGQSFVIENKPGGGATIGTLEAAQRPADGYTLLAVTPTFLITQYVYKDLSYDTMKDFTSVGMFLTTPLVLVAGPSMKASSLSDYIAAAKAKPGEVTFSSSGNGSIPHLAGVLLAQKAGINILHVPFGGGGPALTAVVAGQVDSYFGTPIELREYIKSGAIKALASTSLKPTASIPGVPTLNESGVPGYEVTHFTGLVARSQTPPSVVAQISALLQKALQAPEVKARISQNGDAAQGTAAEGTEVLTKENERWKDVIKSSNITLN
jgi:tripartite-type tricarboxylate transporter receptor subunit TctC